MLYTKKTFDYEHSSKEADIALLGIPWDYSQTGYPTRYGPMFIREALKNVVGYDNETKCNVFEKYKFCDLGDVEVVPGNWKLTQERIIDTIKNMFEVNPNIFPIIIGGDHLITLGVVNAIKKIKGNFTIVDFDAHMDLMNDFLGERYSHFTWARHIPKGIDLRQLGIRSFAKEEESVAKKLKIKNGLNEIKGASYITVDLDVLETSDVGTPEPNGMKFNDFTKLLKKAFESKVIGMDIVESAAITIGSESAILGANIVKKALGYRKA
ncbi:MAG: arginase family protein [Candidatus Aenigmarchaeota archaeon]|nr:arginase family protein [Candidatus Aenigmarchaeota archaeon]